MDTNELEAVFFKAIAHPIRMKVLNVLKDKDCCVCDMVDITKENQPQVSRSLIALKNAGIVESEKQGKNICYKIKNREVFKILEVAARIIKKEGSEIMNAFDKKRKGEN